MRFNKGQQVRNLPKNVHEVQKVLLKTKDGWLWYLQRCSIEAVPSLQSRLAKSNEEVLYYAFDWVNNRLIIVPPPKKRITLEVHYTSLNVI